MQIQQINQADPEKILVAFKNVDGTGSVTTGMGVCLVQAGASIDGISAVQSTAATWEGFIGVSKGDVAINAFGAATIFGIVDSVLISHVGSSITITAGDILKPGAVAGTFFSALTDQAVSTLFYRYLFAATTPVAVSTQAQSYCKAIVRAV